MTLLIYCDNNIVKCLKPSNNSVAPDQLMHLPGDTFMTTNYCLVNSVAPVKTVYTTLFTCGFKDPFYVTKSFTCTLTFSKADERYCNMCVLTDSLKCYSFMLSLSIYIYNAILLPT